MNNPKTIIVACVLAMSLSAHADDCNLCDLAGDFTASLADALNNGENPNQTDEEGLTPLHYAASKGNIESAKLLIDAGANVNYAQSILGNTALMFAMSRYNTEMAELLLLAEADVNAVNNDNLTALSIAAHYGTARNIILLMTEEEDSEEEEEDRYVPPNINHQDINGKTPLIIAVEQGRQVAVQFLLEYGANPDVFDHVGKTALFWAIELDNTTIANILVRLDADVNIKNSQSETPMDAAILYNRRDIIDIIRDNGGFCNTTC